MAKDHSTPRRRWPQDLTGMRFERLVAIEKDPNSKKTRWICKCDCGAVRSVLPYALLTGKHLSCGCLARERSSKRMTNHGMSMTSLYHIWFGIKARSEGKSKEPCYQSVFMCEHWKSFENFRADMGDRPDKKYSIDRIENSGGYTCGKCSECLEKGWKLNCRWATKQQQSENRSVTHFITHNGETHTLAEWARIISMPVTTLCNRLKRGWSENDALTKPSFPRQRRTQKTTSQEHIPPASEQTICQT